MRGVWVRSKSMSIEYTMAEIVRHIAVLRQDGLHSFPLARVLLESCFCRAVEARLNAIAGRPC
jgi:hypothetical protein